MTLSTTIVISTYNGENYIQEQLKSLKDQSQAPDQVLIFDDRSSDNTVSLVNNFIDTHHLTNWAIFVNEKNKGWEKNFMDGMRKAEGDLVFPCDQDDFWQPNKLEIMSRCMEKHPEIQVLISDYQYLYKAKGHDSIISDDGDGQLSQIKVSSHFMKINRPGCVFCARTQFAKQAYNYWFSKCPHDALLWRLAMFSNGLYHINKRLIQWRQHNDSAYKKQNKIKSLKYQIDYLQYASDMTDSLKRFVEDTHGSYEYLILLDKHQNFIALRKKFYKTKNPFLMFKLLAEIRFYPRNRTILRDIYTVYFGK